MSASLLPPSATTSDAYRPDSGTVHLRIDSLVPMRELSIEATRDQSVGALNAQFIEALRKQRDTEPHSVALVQDGTFLDERKSLRAAGVTHESCIVAIALRAPHRTRWHAAAAFAAQWWPLLLACVLALVLVIAATSGARGAENYDEPLVVFVCVGAWMLLPFALVLSGAVQEEKGFRLLWFWPHRPLVWLVGLNALLGLVWLILGARWLLRSSVSHVPVGGGAPLLVP